MFPKSRSLDQKQNYLFLILTKDKNIICDGDNAKVKLC
jgi:hypothetical protein